MFGVHDKHPHTIVGTNQSQGTIGKLEQDIYREKNIRVELFELFEDNKRVLVIKVPGRPPGKVYKFEDVALMRVGEELLPMSDEQYLKIIQEQEPDFSEKFCMGLSVNDLDSEAIQKMKDAYALKQSNPSFQSLSNEQALSDLGLVKNNKVTYAALILVGKPSKIKEHLPQSSIYIEYRNSLTQINFDKREVFTDSYFMAIEKIWGLINDRNGSIPVQQGPYIFDIPFFNKEVIREAINNAVAHRDYRRTSEVVVKQFPNDLHIINPGGFPLGVNIENLLTVNSTPRNRLLADVMAKTGVVERSGQGVDKIFYQTISEAKAVPDYTRSDDFQVELRLSGLVEDKAFALFIRQIQSQRNVDNKLSVQDVIVLNRIRKAEDKKTMNPEVVKKLEKEGLIEKIGKTNSQKFILSKQYFVFTNNQVGYTVEKPIDNNQSILLVLQHLEEFGKAKMSDFESLLPKMSRDQVKYLVSQLVGNGILDKEGVLKGTIYKKGKRMVDGAKIISRAMELGFDQMKKMGELPND